jgi:phosphoribosylformylglycinamidine (FGAM) synthase-like amidotransferase family enzyme
VLALRCRRELKPVLERFVAEGGLVIGICNGFQTLVKMGMLPNRDADSRGANGSWEREVTLIHNESGRFIDDWVPVRVERESRCVWTKGLEDRMLPVRHGEGRFVARSGQVLDDLEKRALVALRYAAGIDGCPGNPNGSERDIAGICDPGGRILGLMPHPEAFLVDENHPLRRRGSRDRPGLDLFENGVRAARDASG